MPVLQAFDPGMLKISLGSGAASNATFAVTGAAAGDTPIFAIVFDGAAKTVKSVQPASALAITAGACQSTVTATDADTVCLFWLDKSAG